MTVRVGINGFGRIGRSFTRALLARGADKTLRDKEGKSALDLASGEGARDQLADR